MIADAVLDKVKHFTIGFALAGDTPAVKGSGVLIKHGDRHGILTCAHVDTYLRELKRPVGLVRLNRGLAQQAATLDMDEVFSYAAGEDPWEGEDIAFIHLPPHLVGNMDCAFLDADKNFTKPQPDDYRSLHPSTLCFRACRRVHWRNDAAKRQGNDVSKGRTNFRSFAPVRQVHRDVGVLQGKSFRPACQLWRHERRRFVARLRAQTRRRELRGRTSPANRHCVARRTWIAASYHVSRNGAD